MFLSKSQQVATLSLFLGILMTGSFVPAQQKPETEAPAQPSALRFGDREPEGKRSLSGSGEMIEFTPPEGGVKLSSVRVHGSRYGQPDPPDEKFLVYVLSGDQSEVVATRMAPYSLFERGPGRWVGGSSSGNRSHCGQDSASSRRSTGGSRAPDMRS